MTVRLYRWFAADAEAEGHPNPLAVGHMCDVCGCRLDKAEAMTPPLAFRWAVALLEVPRIVAGAALDAIDRRVCRLSNDLGGDD